MNDFGAEPSRPASLLSTLRTHQSPGEWVAVGIAVARYPPHSPVLARLVHTVPTWDVWRRSAHWDKGVQYRRKECGPRVAPQSSSRSNGSAGSAAEADAARSAAHLPEKLSVAARCPCWMRQMACNATFDGMDLNGCLYVLHDRDAKFCAAFRASLSAGGVKGLRVPPRSPNLNAFAERWVRSVKSECLSHFILFGEGSLRRVLKNFCEHYHYERNHQGKANKLL